MFVTDWLASEYEELLKLNTELERSNVELDAFAYAASHDLNTDGEETLDFLERAHRLIDTTLDFTQARLGGGLRVERKPLDLHALTRQVADEVQLSFPRRRLAVSHEGDGTGEWDPDRMAQVLTNLLTNALKYSPEHTPVTVRTRGQEQALTLEVHNLGRAISPELLTRLFAPLKRGKEGTDSGRSLGLGLFIVDHLVRAHGGTVEVKSEEPQGTTFTVHLPRARSTE